MRVLAVCTTCLEEKDLESFSYKSKALGTKHTICKECHKLVARRFYDENREKSKKLSSIWANKHKNRRRAISAEHSARMRYKKICCCCSRDDFLSFYEQRKAGQHVDHIIGLGAGGLHCCKNLQILNASEHGRKSCYERYSRNEPTSGDSHPRSKLNSRQVLLIRELKGEFTGTFLAKFFGVHHMSIYNIWNKKQWVNT